MRKISDWPRAVTQGKREPRALLREHQHQRRRIDFAADRRIAGDDGAGHQLERQTALGELCGGGRALLLAQRIALGEGFGAELGFGVGHVRFPPRQNLPAVIACLVRPCALGRAIQYSRDAGA